MWKTRQNKPKIPHTEPNPNDKIKTEILQKQIMLDYLLEISLKNLKISKR
jgi:hypothetical protein